MSYPLNKTGISLSEVLFSSLILTIVLVSVLLVFIQSVDMSSRIDYQYTAANLAKNGIERIRSAMNTSGGFNSLYNNPTEYEETDTTVNGEGDADINGSFRRTINITPDTSNNRLIQIEVSVTYKYRGVWKTESRISVATLLTCVK